MGGGGLEHHDLVEAEVWNVDRAARLDDYS